jgi:SAM-dependent methyltransferase
MPTSAQLAGMYDEGYTGSEESAFKSLRLAPVYFEIIRPWLPRTPFRFLEIGGSHGHLASTVGERTGADVTLLEPGDSAVRNASARGLRAVRGYAETFTDAKGFDVVFAAHVVEHVPNADDFAAACRKLLRPGGTLLLLTPNANAWKLRSFGRNATWAAPTEHTLLLTAPGAVRLFARHGFIVEARSHVPNWRQYPYFLTRQLSHLLTRFIGKPNSAVRVATVPPVQAETSSPNPPERPRANWRLYLRRSGRLILWTEYVLLAAIDILAGESRRDELLIVAKRTTDPGP